MLAGLGLFIAAGLLLYHFIPSELSPAEDMNEIDAYIQAPRDASFQYTDSYVQQLEKIYKTIPEIQTVATDVGFWSPSRGEQFITLLPINKRSKSAADIAQEINEKISNISGVKIFVMPAMSPLAEFSGLRGTSISMRVISPTDFKNLHNTMQRLVAAAQKQPEFSFVDSSLKWDGEQFDVTIDREKAADMQIPMQNITNTMSSLLAGRKVGHFEFDGNLYNVIVQMNQTALSNPNVISELYVRNQNNTMVPLQGLVSIQETTNPESLPHFNRLRADALHASLAPGYTVADAVNILQKLAKNFCRIMQNTFLKERQKII